MSFFGRLPKDTLQDKRPEDPENQKETHELFSIIFILFIFYKKKRKKYICAAIRVFFNEVAQGWSALNK